MLYQIFYEIAEQFSSRGAVCYHGFLLGYLIGFLGAHLNKCTLVGHVRESEIEGHVFCEESHEEDVQSFSSKFTQKGRL